MPDVVTNEELNALAAEYVLGTLDYEERKGASALLEVLRESDSSVTSRARARRAQRLTSLARALREVDAARVRHG